MFEVQDVQIQKEIDSEGIKPIVTGINAQCGNCGNAVSLYQVDFVLGYQFNYCNNCGKPINWGGFVKLVAGDKNEGGSDK